MAVIYSITNLINSKQYIGSSKNPKIRWKQHLHLLQKNQHHSIYLQNSFNKHGLNNFTFKVIKDCSEKEQYELEQFFIDYVKPDFNHNLVAEKPPISKGQPFYLVSPEGKESKGKNLKKFCIENNLNYTATSTLINGGLCSHRGWTTSLKNYEKLKVTGQVFSGQFSPFFLIDPDGKLHYVINQSKFCREHHLQQSNITRVKDGLRPSHKGWTSEKTFWNFKPKRKISDYCRRVIKRYISLTNYSSLPEKNRKSIRQKLISKFKIREGYIYETLGGLL